MNFKVNIDNNPFFFGGVYNLDSMKIESDFRQILIYRDTLGKLFWQKF